MLAAPQIAAVLRKSLRFMKLHLKRGISSRIQMAATAIALSYIFACARCVGPTFCANWGAHPKTRLDLTYQSKRWITNRIAVAPRGTSSPVLRLPVNCEIIPTVQGRTAGPTDARENITAPMLRAETP